MSETLTKRDVLTIGNKLRTLVGLKGAKLAFAIAKNMHRIEAEAKALAAAIEPSEKFQEYENRRQDLCMKHCKNDESGKPLVDNGAYIMIDQKLYEEDLDKLKEEFKEAVEERESQEKEYSQLLKEDSSVELFKINEKLIPKDITVEQMHALMYIVEETN